jgi:SAM-dependent methyltransferase
MTDDPGIRDIRGHWERQARIDPLWAILSDPAKKGRKWRPAEFFETGRREISVLMFNLRRLGIPVARDAALDFGCGVGRLSQALALHFDRVAGVDISETMIRLAETANRFPGKVRYVRSENEDLPLFGDAEFDFIYTNIVLQHLPPALIRGFWGGFRRVLKPGGLLVFQLPSHRIDLDAPASSIEAMAPEAYAARIALGDIPGSSLAPSESVTLEVRIRNASPRDWVRSEIAPIRAANHWLSGDGQAMLVQDDGRADLPPVVEAGGECLVFLEVTAPPEPGRYRLEVDLVHEMVAWFKDRGSPAPQVGIRVREGDAADPVSAAVAAPDGTGWQPAGPGPGSEDPKILEALLGPRAGAVEDPGASPMYGILRADVVEFFESRGDRMLHVEEDSHAGKEWAGFRYYVGRGKSP